MSRQIVTLGIVSALVASVAQAQTLIGLRVEGPAEVIENSVTLYTVMAEFDNGWEFDVTLDSFLWVDPGLHADIGVFGDLQAYEVASDGLETINAIYIFGPDIESATLDVTVRNVPLAGFALDFDPDDDFVRIPDVPILQLSDQVTVEAWVRANSVGPRWSRIVTKGHLSTNGGFILAWQQNNDRRVQFQFRNSSVGTWFAAKDDVPTDVYVGEWHHIAGVYSASGGFARVYVDGILKDQVDDIGPLDDYAGRDLLFGTDDDFDRSFFDGLFDEIRIWNVARSEEDIVRDMNRTLAGNEAGLVGYWRFDEGDGQYALDSSPYGNDGVLGSDADPAGDAADPQWQLSGAGITDFPVAGHGLVFDGGHHVLVPDSASLSITSSLTLETWARLNNSGGSWQQLVFKGDTRSGLDPYYLRVIGGQLELGIVSDQNELGAVFADALQFDWTHAHHIAGVFEDESDQLRIYVDGILQAVASTALQPLADQQDMHVRFGKEARNLQHLDGALDEIRIWNVARSRCDIRNNMNRPLRGDEPGLVGYWRFDEGEGQDVLDLSPFANHGTLGGDSAPGSDDPMWELSGADLGAPPVEPIGWSVPETVLEVSSGDDWAVSISGDALEMYLSSERDGFAESDIYRAVRASVNDAFSTPVVVPELSIPGFIEHDAHPNLSANGLRMYFVRHHGNGPGDIFLSERPSPNDPWDVPVAIDSLNTTASEFALAISGDELFMVITSDRDGTMRYWTASRAAVSDPWGNLQIIDALDGFSPRSCCLTQDALTLFVTAQGPSGLGGWDVWRLTRASTAEPFANPMHHPELSSNKQEFDVSISGDGRTLYLVRQRTSNAGDVYVSRLMFPDETFPGDLDCDGDLDLEDYDLFAACLTGPVGAVGLQCAAADYTSDGHVDLRDFGRFQALFTGPAP